MQMRDIRGNNILIIGGAGFIGVNTARHFIKRGAEVTIFDNLSRKGSDVNLSLLEKEFGQKFKFIKGDITQDFELLAGAVEEADAVVHLAAQVAVTTSIADPRKDFEMNALGSFNVLEAVRTSKKEPFLIYSSTNKVYGSLHGQPVEEIEKRYRFSNNDAERYGIGEGEPLDFHSPYGCSKGAADQYTIDYSRIYGLKTVVLRQSCIYGPFQFGVEDQGWLAWFSIAALLGKPITLYGNGKQVRDALYVEDLAELYALCMGNQDKVAGQAFNIGGGVRNTLSLLELLDKLKEHFGREIPFASASVRAGDQPLFIADVRKIAKAIGWEPATSIDQGFKMMVGWIEENRDLIEKTVA